MNDHPFGQHNAIVMAHPDDETLWAGGLPIVFPDLNWTVICCSIPRRDPVRAWKFHDACVMLGAMPRLLPYREQEINEVPVGLDTIDLSPFDCVVTHNQYGEYGHFHHQCVHRWVTEFSRYAGRIVTLGYRFNATGAFRVELSPEQLQLKLAALACYDHELPYEGEVMAKWKALRRRYYEGEHIDPQVETYDVHQ